MKKIFIYTFIFIAANAIPIHAQENTTNSTQEHYRLGKIYYEHGLYTQAQEEFEKALKGKKSTTTNNAPSIAINQEAIAPKQNIKSYTDDPIPSTEYTIDKGDSLKVTVWENPDLTQELIVRPDGKISFPLTGELAAKGKTIQQLDYELTTSLSEYIRHPDVSITLKEMGGNKIIVLGEVNRPGKYSLNDASTVIDAIASAGGFSRDAIQNSIIVISGGLKNPVPRRVHVQKAIRGGMMADNNIQLTSKDIVFVPRKFVADMNYFMMKILEPLTSGTGTESTVKGL